MFAKYRVKEEVVEVFISENAFKGKDFLGGPVSVTVYENNKEYDRTVRTDENGKTFFTWNKEKVFIENYEAPTIEEVKEIIEKKEFLNSNLFMLMLRRYGYEKFRFTNHYIPSMWISSSKVKDELVELESQIILGGRYNPDTNYKITIAPVDEKFKDIYKEDMYISDFVSCFSKQHFQEGRNVILSN